MIVLLPSVALAYSMALKDVWLGFHEESRDAFLLSLYPVSLVGESGSPRGEAFLSSSYWWFGGLNFRAGGSYTIGGHNGVSAEINIVSLGTYSQVDENGNEIGQGSIMAYGFRGAYTGALSFAGLRLNPVASLQMFYASMGFSVFSFGLDGGLLIKRSLASVGKGQIFLNFRNLLSDWMYVGAYVGYEFSLKNGVYFNSLVGLGSRVFSGFYSPEVFLKSRFPVPVSKDVSVDGVTGLTVRYLPSQDVPVEFRLFVGGAYSVFEAGFLMGSVGSAGLFYGVSGSMMF